MSAYLKNVLKKIQKATGDSTIGLTPWDQQPDVTGMMLNDPLMEFLFQRQFIAYGRAYLVYGRPAAGKSTFISHLLKLPVQQGGTSILADIEHAVDREYATRQGVDTSKVFFLNVDTLEQGLTGAIELIKGIPDLDNPDAPTLIALDSLSAGSTDDENSDKFNLSKGEQVGGTAKKLATFYRVMLQRIRYENAIFVATNERRDKINTTGARPGFLPPEVALKGGEAQKFRSTCQLEVSKLKNITATDEYGADTVVGSTHKITCVRNKLGMAGKTQTISFSSFIDGGIDTSTALVHFLMEKYPSVVSKKGHGYAWGLDEYPFTLPDGETGVIKHDEKYKAEELGQLLANSDSAKAKLRDVLHIAPLPSDDEKGEKEEERKKNRDIMRNKSDAEIARMGDEGLEGELE